jgi:hypothetical protein
MRRRGLIIQAMGAFIACGCLFRKAKVSKLSYIYGPVINMMPLTAKIYWAARLA